MLLQRTIWRIFDSVRKCTFHHRQAYRYFPVRMCEVHVCISCCSNTCHPSVPLPDVQLQFMTDCGKVLLFFTFILFHRTCTKPKSQTDASLNLTFIHSSLRWKSSYVLLQHQLLSLPVSLTFVLHSLILVHICSDVTDCFLYVHSSKFGWICSNF